MTPLLAWLAAQGYSVGMVLGVNTLLAGHMDLQINPLEWQLNNIHLLAQIPLRY